MHPAAELEPDVLIERQRKTIAEHITHEQSKHWPAVYGTFTPYEEDAYYDVVPFQKRFPKMQGVVDFYQTFASAFPDFHIIVYTEHDVPGVPSARCRLRRPTEASIAVSRQPVAASQFR